MEDKFEKNPPKFSADRKTHIPSHQLPKLYGPLKENLAQLDNLEAKLDAIRLYKTDYFKKLKKKIFTAPLDLSLVMAQLSDLADSILIATYFLARQEVQKDYGTPFFQDSNQNFYPAELALIGMGKLGGRELHFGSDLDIIFVFNRRGQTKGGKKLSNQELFAKIAQRIISYLTLPTAKGFAYKVDTELRPSGNAGALVTTLHAWINYYRDHAALWEKQALLKARLIYGSGGFSKEFEGIFHQLTFVAPFPATLASEIHYLRTRMEKELAKETTNHWNYKKGLGGLTDIEFSVQFLQLKLGKVFPDLLTTNTLEALRRMKRRSTLALETIELFQESYQFYRRLEIFLELKFNLGEDYLDINHSCVSELASLMGYKNKKEFLDQFQHLRQEVRAAYMKTLKMAP